jgi:hypothetical protein
MHALFGPAEMYQGFVNILFGSALFAVSPGMYCTSRLFSAGKKRYYYLLAAGVFISSLGLLSQGVPWLLRMHKIPLLYWVGLVGSLAAFALCEITFLANNGWRFIPSNPK